MKKSLLALLLFSYVMAVSCSGVPEKEKIEKNPSQYSVMPVKLIEGFKAECARILEEHESAVPGIEIGRDDWAYQISEIRYGASFPYYGKWATRMYPGVSPEKADPLNAILHFRDQLAAVGIELLLMPVPDRPVIYPEGILDIGDFRDADVLPDIKPMRSRFMDLIRRAGIYSIDLGPYFLQNRNNEHGPVFCKSDTHWTPSGTVLAAGISAEFIRNRSWYQGTLDQYQLPEGSLQAEWMDEELIGHCVKKLQRFEKAMDFSPESLAYRKIKFPGRKPGKTSQEKLRHPEAPITVFGDSNTLRWNELYAAYPQELEFEIRLPIDTISTSGGGINQARMSFVREYRQNPDYLKGKKLVIWVFTIRAVIEARPCWIDTPFEGGAD
jgi:alginate O-acetyltransferase complex protein AlgJ